MCGGQNGHFHGCAYISYPPPTPYYNSLTFSCEVNRNKVPMDDDLKEIKYMLRYLVGNNKETQLQMQRQEATIRNLEAQVSQLVETFNAQQVNIMDISRE